MNPTGQPRRMRRLPGVQELVPLKRSTIYALMARDEFPKPVKLGKHCVAWYEDEVLAWRDRESDPTVAA